MKSTAITDRRISEFKKYLISEEKSPKTVEEYLRLLGAAANKRRIRLVMQTLCSTGIRVLELSRFTVEAVKTGEVSVKCKSKQRTVLLPAKLKRVLLEQPKTWG